MSPISDPKPSVLPAGRPQVAEVWCGSLLIGMLHQEHDAILLRLESHARGPVTVSAVALERALAEARGRLTRTVDVPSEPLLVSH